MDIAPGIDASEWMRLKLDDPNTPDWTRAIEIGRARIYGRYFDAVDVLIQAEEGLPAHKKRYGFAILAIDCLLVETFQAFKDGITDTTGQSKPVFKRFLETSPSFRSHFKDDQLREDFYKHFRCGILHQGETKKGSRVWSIGRLVWRSKEGIIVNRTEFHQSLKNDFDLYLKELAENSDPKSRENYRTVMGHIARIAKT